ncbi:MAG TPA: hypothetical protein VLE69_01705 [Candidatus Saccharimonadales bacterium]|nr:hypothetical protein [Candidatus Saccharimonadales bacterium]
MDPLTIGDNKIFLKGLMQISTAFDALRLADVSPETQTRLAEVMDLHRTFATDQTEFRHVRFYMSGPSVPERKTAIISSLLLMERNLTCADEQRSAARGLLDILGIEK